MKTKLIPGTTILLLALAAGMISEGNPARESGPLAETEIAIPALPARTGVKPALFQENIRQIKALVSEAAAQVRTKGEGVFSDFRVSGSKWRQGEKYIYVLDTEGNMLVHADASLEGKNQLELKDKNGRPIIRGLLEVTQASPGKTEGWHHYEWPAPGKTMPAWKSSYAQLVKAPSGKTYLVGSGIYTEQVEKEFVTDAVKNAVGQIEKRGEAAFQALRDPKGPYRFQEAYMLVIDMNGVELVNPAFPEYEGKNVLDTKDSKGRKFIKEMLQVAEKDGEGWVNYMWPKPGQTEPSQKSTYVSKARMGNKWVMVGCGVYLNAPAKVSAGK